MYFERNLGRILFFIFGFFIAVSTLLYTSNLFRQLAEEEAQEVSLFAEALKNLGEQSDYNLNIYWSVLQMNNTVPILIFDNQDNLVQHKNIDFKPQEFTLPKKEMLRKKNINETPIQIQIGKGQNQFIYYGYSPTLTKLRYMPFIQLVLILLFIVLGSFIYKSIQQSYQNKLWVGLSKETAHQLGTPISALIAWLDLMKEQKIAPYYVPEMTKDVERLKVISERFSSIGSKPKEHLHNIVTLIQETVNYMAPRISKSVELRFEKSNEFVIAKVNKELFMWVIENLIRNSVDAILKKGKITITTEEYGNNIYLDITDTGRGIPPKMLKKVFEPGYTTKKRGWGLGLSLTKRIIKDFHNGRIFVKNSEIGKGTTFRIILHRT